MNNANTPDPKTMTSAEFAAFAKQQARYATACLVTVSLIVKMVDGHRFTVLSMPWNCLSTARDLALAGAESVSAFAGEGPYDWHWFGTKADRRAVVSRARLDKLIAAREASEAIDAAEQRSFERDGDIC